MEKSNQIHVQALAAHASIEQTATLRAILKVLVDTHCKDMEAEQKAEYWKSIQAEMKDMRDILREVSDPSKQP